jgi:hypothetical protein
MDILVATFIAWIVAKTGLPAPQPPQVLFLPPEKLVERAYGPNGHRDLDLQALYDHASTTVYLPVNWRSNDLRQSSALLHELVHHVQWANNHMEGQCRGQLERQAYDLQIMWLREQGVANPHDVIGVDEFTIFLISRCPQSDSD